MKNLILSIFLLSCFSVFGQNSFDRWVPTSGTDTYTTNIINFPGSYNNTQAYVKFGNTNTGAATININSLGAANLRKWDGDSWEPLTSGQIDVNTVYKIAYNGSYFTMESFGSGIGSTPTLQQVLTAGSVLTAATNNVDINYDFVDEKILNFRIYGNSDTTAYSGITFDTEFGGLTTRLIGQNAPNIYTQYEYSAGGTAGFSLNNGIQSANLVFDAPNLTTRFNDNRTTKVGLQYAADYSAGFTARSLVDKAYVDLKAPLASPTFTGTPTAPTPIAADNSTKISTTVFVNNKIILNASPTITFFGDSYTNSFQASPSTAGFVGILQATLSASVSNQAVNGLGWYSQATLALDNISVNNRNPSIVTTGFNDIRRGGSASATIEKIKGGARSLIANAMLSTAVAANDASVTPSGTWNTTSGIGDKASTNLLGLVRTSSASGNTLSWTFSGSTLVIGTFNTDQSGVTSGDWTYAIDGGSPVTFTGKNKTDGISDGVNSNDISPNVVVVTGLGNSSHTVVVTASEASPAYIDYFGTLRQPQECAPVIINSIPYMTVTGYTIAPASGSIAAADAANAGLLSVVNEFNLSYPIFYNDVNSYFSTSTGVGADDIHPNNLGYQQIANSILSILKPTYISTAGSNPIALSDGSGNSAFYGNSGDISILSVNRNPITGLFVNVGKAAAQINLTGANGDGNITFSTMTTNNTLPVQKLKIENNGNSKFSGGVQVQSALVTPTGDGAEMEFNSGTAYLTAVNRTGTVWRPWIIRGSTINLTANSGGTTASQANLSSVWSPTFRITPGAHTAQTTATEFKNFFIDGGITQTGASGTTATQRNAHIGSITYAGTSGTRTATNAYGLYVESYTVGTNAAITNNYALGTDGNIALVTAGNGIYIKEGSNATMGVATLSAGAVTVSTTKVTANSRIQLTVQSLGTVAVPMAIGVTARSAGTSFTITSADGTDTSVVAWTIFEPAP